MNGADFDPGFAMVKKIPGPGPDPNITQQKDGRNFFLNFFSEEFFLEREIQKKTGFFGCVPEVL